MRGPFECGFRGDVLNYQFVREKQRKSQDGLARVFSESEDFWMLHTLEKFGINKRLSSRHD